jgi:hypothetical protein
MEFSTFGVMLVLEKFCIMDIQIEDTQPVLDQ